MSVKVGVRVRPFNKRQEQLNCRLCVEMEGNVTQLIDSDGNPKNFAYDYSFWSHDGFTTDENGVHVPTGDKYADQKRVYSEIGKSILDNAWQGYNCCLFAYGQTGSGKSYSMIGYGQNKGIIPIVCDEIFKKIQQTKEPNKAYEVTVSMMEIYNETVRDLLSHKHDTDLKICEHKKYGVYVEGLIKTAVHSFPEIERKIQEGSKNRSIAATLMNQSSSRSHTIVSINFTQKLQVSKAQMSMKYSVIHLVDLAGSQCVAKTGAISRDRLRETAKINQSLSTLGRVIEALAQNSSKLQKGFVPYRDSKLTFILRNALGGNSQTAMICAISPADDNMEETLSTLRYASRAKKIQNKAIVNESDVDKLIRQLREENQMLKKLLEEARKNKNNMSQASIDEMNLINQGVASMGYEEVDQEENLLDDTHDMKPKSSEEIPEVVEDNSPYITNISEDQLLSFRLKYNIKQQLVIGNKQGNPKPDVVLGALGVQPLHAKIIKENEEYFIDPLEESASDYLYLNGEYVLKKTKIFHLDRIVLGTGCVFLFKAIGTQPRKTLEQKDIDYQMAISELSNLPSKSIIEEGELRQQILKEIQTEYEKTKQENEEKLKKEIEKQQEQYRQKLKEIQDQKSSETLKLKQELEAKSQQAKLLEEERIKAAEEVQKYIKLEQELQKSQLEKAAYEQTKQILQEKLEKVKELEHRLQDTKQKQEEMKHEIEQKEELIRKELQTKTIMCQNENIMNDYKLQLNKKSKDAKELRDYFIKKEKIELQKQLVELVPIVERFNLMAKDMRKRIEATLSVKYKYISDTEIGEVLKSGAYKGKFQVEIKIKNKEEGRNYFWNSDIFKNRYELAQEMFDIFISEPSNPRLSDKSADPYWDPPQFQTKGYGYILMESIFYNLSLQSQVQIVFGGEIIGSIEVKLFPCNTEGQETSISQEGLQLQSPRELIDKTIHFCITMQNLKLVKPFKKILFEYQLYGNSYKKHTFRTDESTPGSFGYKKIHEFKDISESLLLHHSQKPLEIEFKAYPEPERLENVKSLNSSFASNKQQQETEEITSQQVITCDIKEFNEISPPKINKRGTSGEKAIVFDNTEVLQKIQRDYNNKKSLIQKKKEKQKQWMQTKTKKTGKGKEDRECIIY